MSTTPFTFNLPDKFKKPFNFIVGCVILFFCFKLIVGSNLFASNLPQTGKLAVGSPTGDFLQSLLESGFALVSGLGAFATLRMLGILNMLYAQIAPLFNTPKPLPPLTPPPPPIVQNQPPSAHPVQFIQSINSTNKPPVGMMDDLARLLVQSAIDKDWRMTVVIAEKIAGENYVSEQFADAPQAVKSTVRTKSVKP